MIYGLTGGLLWALDTVILGVVLSLSPLSLPGAIFIAPLISTFLHDLFSSMILGSKILLTKDRKTLPKLFHKKGILLIILAGLLGGPVGMTGYVSSIKYLGAGPTAVFSSLFPAVGCVMSLFFLNEKMTKRQILGLASALIAVSLLSFSDMSAGEDLLKGFSCAALCILGWASEAVLVRIASEKTGAGETETLFIRQTVSALTYIAVLLPLFKGYGLVGEVLESNAIRILLLASVFGTLSYLCYYRAIGRLGAGKAMSLNVTYTAWSVIFSAILTRHMPPFTQMILSVIVVIGSLFASGCFNREGEE